MNGILVSHAKAAGIIYLNDGTELQFPVIEVPAASDKYIKAKDEDKHVQKFEATEIRYLELWNDKKPDDHHLLIYVPYSTPTLRNKNMWAAFVTQSENLRFFVVSSTYAISDDGKLSYVYYQGNRPIPILYERQKDAYLTAYFTSSFGYGKKDIKRIQDFLMADPLMVEYVGTKEFKGFDRDFVYIVDNYTPSY